MGIRVKRDREGVNAIRKALGMEPLHDKTTEELATHLGQLSALNADFIQFRERWYDQTEIHSGSVERAWELIHNSLAEKLRQTALEHWEASNYAK